ncbi:MAG TPA: secretin N-terminal domain-containing protein [Patescibacteria group bacterium]|nr:secretin N-terminal domain-containing protein [Patescibacteria group bacterium]
MNYTGRVFLVLALVLMCAAPAFTQTVSESAPGKISLDIKGMDVVDVLKMLASRAGMSVVVGKNVSGRVALFLKDVDVNDAFEIVIASNELAYEKKGAIISVMTQRDYELLYGERYGDKRQVKTIQLKYAKAEELSKSLNQIKTSIGRVVVDDATNTVVLMDMPEKLAQMEELIKKTDLATRTQVFSLSYAQADKIQPKIQDALTKGVGSVKIDERTNKIAVTDYPDTLAQIGNIIAAFDEKTPQVLIDAQIVEIRPSDKFEMGVDWDYWIRKHFKASAALPINQTAALLVGTPDTAPGAAGDYKAVLDLLRTIGDTKILSSPRIMAMNNQEARILVGTKDAYITSSSSQAGSGATITSQAVNFVDVGIKLYVTPTVNRDGFVTMKIRPEISSSTRTNITADGKVTQIPIVTTSEAETTVMIKDGVTIIIGGLRKDSRIKTVKKIPLAGDIPLVGCFFRSTSDEVTKTELVILLTPHVISGEKPYTDFDGISPRQGAVVKMIKGDIVRLQVSQDEGADAAKEDAQKASEYYMAIYSKIDQSIKANWPHAGKGKVSLRFVLSKDGTFIADPQVVETAQQDLAPLAIKAIKDCVPFSPFPESITKDRETFFIEIDYK